MSTAVVVGSGPNGIAAAITLADAGVEVTVLEAADRLGGGMRSSELTIPGLLHDECSAAHPLALDTPFSRKFDLTLHGLQWARAEVEYSHPLDGGGGATAFRSLERTAEALPGSDGKRWKLLFAYLEKNFSDITVDFVQPVLHLPSHPIKLARFGLKSGPPAAITAKLFGTEEGRALFAGVAAHAFRPFTAQMSSAIGVTLGTAAHVHGWPVAVGGSEAIARAMITMAESRGVKFETGVNVASLGEIAGADVVMLDTAPEAAAEICGDAIPGRVSRGLRGFKHGPGAFKLDLAVEGGIPWQHEESRLAGTVHVGGSYEDIAAAEKMVCKGEMPERPYVLVCQQSLADPGRAKDGVHPVYAYAHVPTGWTGDASEEILGQIERFAPGFRDRIVGTHTRDVAAMEAHNPNYIGGDIVTGANSLKQMIFRPRPTLDPYSLGADGLYICSAATPPGAGAHGMCGFNAANSALKKL